MDNDFNDVPSVLAGAVRFEEYGQDLYNDLAEAIDDDKAKSLFKFLASEEAGHKSTLEGLLSKYERPDATMDFDPQGLFGEPLEKVDSGDHVSVVGYAIELERRSISTYTKGAELAKDAEVREVFGDLIEFEKSHLQILEENQRMLRNEGAWYGYTPILD